METATLLTFIITRGWVNSPYCWEELDWAVGNRTQGHHKNLILIDGDDLKEQLEFGEIHADDDRNSRSWNDSLGANRAFKCEIRVVNSVDEIIREIRQIYPSERADRRSSSVRGSNHYRR